jgi:hypothetical protein
MVYEYEESGNVENIIELSLISNLILLKPQASHKQCSVTAPRTTVLVLSIRKVNVVRPQFTGAAWRSRSCNSALGIRRRAILVAFEHRQIRARSQNRSLWLPKHIRGWRR